MDTNLGAIALPQGGGAISPLGESFQSNAFTGTASLTVPIAISPGRSGFEPHLALEYNTGFGNGYFGLGWQVILSRISRKTQTGVPQYRDADLFTLSGGEDLVEVGARTMPGFNVVQYRPRTEAEFSRIERWIATNGDSHWRVTSSDNITNVYGLTAEARIADPDVPSHVFEWLLQERVDPRGNHILYEYAADHAALTLGEPHERGRKYLQRYPRRIYYGNISATAPLLYADGVTPVGPEREGLDHEDLRTRRKRRYTFEVIFDYGDLAAAPADPYVAAEAPESFGGPGRPAPVRPDPFSSFRAGFEVRTLRRCVRVLMIHHFKELGGPTLVRSTDVTYAPTDAGFSLLQAITARGYVRSGSTYQQQAMPPVEFRYSLFEPDRHRYRSLTDAGSAPERSLADHEYALVDVFGDGLPDVVHGGATGFRVWRNNGGVFERPRTLPDQPAGLSLGTDGVTFADVAGDGLPDLLVGGPRAGVFEMTSAGGWKPFRRFESAPAIDLSNAHARAIDLTGDGRSDLLFTGDGHFVWFENRGEAGYAAPRHVERIHDLDLFPDVFFGDASGRVRIADMNGDGLDDIVLLHDGRVDYWPNLGYGQFGARVTMSRAPLLGTFDPRRLFFVDLDGTGCADAVYVESGRVRFWFNQSGNSWSAEHRIHGTPAVTNADAVTFADVFGTGTATLVWTSDHGVHPGGNYKALDFCGGVKPYLLTEMHNNLGAITKVHYAPSTRFCLEDRRAGRPWLTSLPFPVHVVEKVEVIDRIGRSRLTTTYRYHHGYYDGREREFRGFGRVDRFDTESFDESSAATPADGGTPPAHHVPPVETRTWFHTGIYVDEDRIDSGAPVDADAVMRQFRDEYYAGDAQAFALDPHELPPTGSPREAFRALRGLTLRCELYGRDGTPAAPHPYLVTENRFRVTLVQPGVRGSAVYRTTGIDSLSYHYDRDSADPRISHELTLATDANGNVTRQIILGYPRRDSTAAPEQRALRPVLTATTYINTPDFTPAVPFLYVGVAADVRTFEVLGMAALWTSPRLLTAQDFAAVAADPDDFVGREAAAPAGLCKRLLHWTRAYFRPDSAAQALDPPDKFDHQLSHGRIDRLALPYDTYEVVFSPSLLASIYTSRVSDLDLRAAGYLKGADIDPTMPPAGRDCWWAPGGRVAFAPRAYYQVQRSQDVLGHVSEVEHDDYALLTHSFTDPMQNRTEAKVHYRVLQPYYLIDANGNRSAVRFDAMGMVSATFVMGRPGANEGDHFDDTVLEASPADDPTTRAQYDLFAYHRDPEGRRPAAFAASARLRHGTTSPWQTCWTYSDGFGREIQRKVPAEPETPGGPPRWVGSGWTIFNNKGKPVRTFEPFFSTSHAFEFGIECGVSPTLFYDPVERVAAIIHPNHTFEKIVARPWREARWDANDTVLLDPRTDPDVAGLTRAYFDAYDAAYRATHGRDPKTWYHERIGDASRPDERRAALKTAAHAATPTLTHFDADGRPFLTIVDTGTEALNTQRTLDVEGHDLTVVDPRGLTAFTNRVDGLGRKLSIDTPDAGVRLCLPDAAGRAFYEWDALGTRVRSEHDRLGRLTHLWVTPAGGTTHLAERVIYGEAITDPAVMRNHRGRVWQTFDGAGAVVIDAYDFKGNVLRSRRRLTRDTTAEAVWSDASSRPLDRAAREVLLEPGTGHLTATVFNALNHAVSNTTPDGSVTYDTRNEANLLVRVEVAVRGGARQTFMDTVSTDAKGQRTRVVHGNKVETTITYDAATSRMTRSTTRRRYDSSSEVIQDLEYTYDPAGNVSSVRDHAVQRIWHDQAAIDAVSDYTYDAAYRLIVATGREHRALGFNDSRDVTAFKRSHFIPLPPPTTDAQALQMYTEEFTYDRGGNLKRTAHYRGALLDPAVRAAASPMWIRRNVIDTAGGAPRSNRLLFSRSTDLIVPLGTPDVTYDGNGNALTLDGGLQRLHWNFKNLPVRADLNLAGDSATYQYDATVQRTRKRVIRGGITEEWLYLGGLDIYRRTDSAGLLLERYTRHVMDGTHRLALVETANPGTATERTRFRYQLANHLGSAVLEVDGTDDAAIISYEEHYPYGETSFISGRSRSEVSDKRYRYAGKERDDETGLYCYGARYYAPWLARWISCDPSQTGGANLYQFALANPVVLTDPNGHRAATPKEAAELESLEKQEMDAHQKFNDLSPAGQFWDFMAKNGGYSQQAARAGYTRRQLEAAIARANEGESVAPVPGPVPGTNHYLTAREIETQRLLNSIDAMRSSSLAAATNMAANAAGLDDKTVDGLTMTAANISDMAAAHSMMRQARDANLALMETPYGGLSKGAPTELVSPASSGSSASPRGASKSGSAPPAAQPATKSAPVQQAPAQQTPAPTAEQAIKDTIRNNAGNTLTPEQLGVKRSTATPKAAEQKPSFEQVQHGSQGLSGEELSAASRMKKGLEFRARVIVKGDGSVQVTNPRESSRADPPTNGGIISWKPGDTTPTQIAGGRNLTMRQRQEAMKKAQEMLNRTDPKKPKDKK